MSGFRRSGRRTTTRCRRKNRIAGPLWTGIPAPPLAAKFLVSAYQITSLSFDKSDGQLTFSYAGIDYEVTSWTFDQTATFVMSNIMLTNPLPKEMANGNGPWKGDLDFWKYTKVPGPGVVYGSADGFSHYLYPEHNVEVKGGLKNVVGKSPTTGTQVTCVDTWHYQWSAGAMQASFSYTSSGYK